jgi:hypothetical protein
MGELLRRLHLDDLANDEDALAVGTVVSEAASRNESGLEHGVVECALDAPGAGDLVPDPLHGDGDVNRNDVVGQ